MYISLYRRYRPQTFSDMVGQSAAVGVLMESLREGSLGHAYLFSGPRGCGKTSAARLVAKSLDCLNRKDDCEPCGVCENCRAIAAGEHLERAGQRLHQLHALCASARYATSRATST